MFWMRMTSRLRWNTNSRLTAARLWLSGSFFFCSSTAGGGGGDGGGGGGEAMATLFLEKSIGWSCILAAGAAQGRAGPREGAARGEQSRRGNHCGRRDTMSRSDEAAVMADDGGE